MRQCSPNIHMEWTRLLSDTEFRETFREPIRRISSAVAPPFEFWNYFEHLREADFRGHECIDETVTYVYESGGGKYQHVLVNTDAPNTFMVLVLDLVKQEVYGHCLLDLGHEYDLPRT